jgi:hypothetical protein
MANGLFQTHLEMLLSLPPLHLHLSRQMSTVSILNIRVDLTMRICTTAVPSLNSMPWLFTITR